MLLSGDVKVSDVEKGKPDTWNPPVQREPQLLFVSVLHQWVASSLSVQYFSYLCIVTPKKDIYIIYIHIYYICIIWIRWYIASFVHSIFEPTNQKGHVFVGKEKWWPEVLTSLEWWFMVYVCVHITYIHTLHYITWHYITLHTLCNDGYNDGFNIQSQGFWGSPLITF